MNTKKPELLIVMPVFNEQASLRKVVLEWFHEVENWTENFLFLVIDDGSNDQSLKILTRLQGNLGERLEIVSRGNLGHGQTCLQGYRLAIERNIPWIFQIDSDGQCDPQFFFRFWRDREKYDVIYGNRIHRDDGWRRVVASLVLRFTLLYFARVWCVDANVPYRLMKTSMVQRVIEKIPPDFFLANVGLAVLLRRDTFGRQGVVPIRFRERYGGEPSVQLSKFGMRAVELVQQLNRIRIHQS